MRSPLQFLSLGRLLLAVCLASTAPAMAADALRFNRDIRPILSDNCFHCHGPDAKHRKGKLRLDVREEALAKEAFVPGKPEESELIHRLVTSDPEDLMPPPESHKTLTARQIDLLKRWVAEGAVYEPHWSYTPIVRPPVPAVQDAAWARTPVDRFLLERLEAAKFRPSPEADRATLLRRLALDLTGLPPTPTEVAAFQRDRSPDAFERQVDRLLASPRYGERMAVPWLDAVRFADTVGYHGDQNQNIFPYRDYVIDAFNRNLPFDRFTREQLAGDLLPDPTVEQRIASGFNRLNMMTREGGAQPREYLVKYAADRVRTVSTAWLGSTLACAECHDHKFDPFTAEDFYTMGAFFDDVKQWGVYMEYTYTPNPELRGWSNDHPFPPELVVTNAYLQRRMVRLRERMDEVVAAHAAQLRTNSAAGAEFKMWLDEATQFLGTWSDGWQVALSPRIQPANTNTQSTFQTLAGGTVIVSGKPVNEDKIVATFGLQTGWFSALRLELIATTNHAGSLFRAGRKEGDVKVAVKLRGRDGKERKTGFYDAQATARKSTFANGHEHLGVEETWKVPATAARSNQFAVFFPGAPLRVEEGDLLEVTLDAETVGAFRLATSPFAAQDGLASGAGARLREALGRSGWRRTGEDRRLLAEAHLLGTAADREAFESFRALRLDLLACRNGTSPTMITVATTNLFQTRILPRGNWLDESQPVLAPATPHFLPGPKPPAEGRLTRLDLANWLTSRENPLTARAMVNRLWKQFYGNGLSNQPEELGTQGEPPTHPELLDWLAAEFIESGWDVKHVVRLLVTSSAYRQDSKGRPELAEEDPNNRLLARQNPRRLEAEFIRDNALAIAGLLDPEIGGPSAFPYQPPGYYVNIQFPDRDYYASRDDRQYRRGLYSHWQRTFLHPMMANFDAPAREECAVDRTQSNTPQQALTLLNDPSFVEAARVFAARLLTRKDLKDDAARIDAAFRQALLRPVKPAESASLLKMLAEQRRHFAAETEDAAKLVKTGQSAPAHGLDPAEHAAWTGVARVVLNLHETITRY